MYACTLVYHVKLSGSQASVLPMIVACLQSSAVREINKQNEAMTCLLILSSASLYIARLTNSGGFTR